MYGADNPFLLTDRFGGVSGAKISILVREIQTLIFAGSGPGGHAGSGVGRGGVRDVCALSVSRTGGDNFYVFFIQKAEGFVKSRHIVFKNGQLSVVVAVYNEFFPFLDNRPDFGVGKAPCPPERRRVSGIIVVKNQPPPDTVNGQQKAR